jgi:UDP-GlcNAc3NAcA epimerase
MKIVTVIGARPQFIKAAALSTKIAEYDNIEEIIVHTGQHFDKNMSDIFFEELKIPNPKYNLEINSLPHGAMTGRMLESIENILIQEKPNLLLVYGDTNSTLAGALAAQKLHVAVAHVEAGLRSYNDKMPEEINRVLTDRLSTYLFCPTNQSKINLNSEGIQQRNNTKIIVTGDIMQDSMNLFKKFSKTPDNNLPQKFILATLHRQENTDDSNRLQQIVSAYDQIGSEIPVVLPLHPRTKKIIENSNNINFNKENIIVIPPVSYWTMLWLLNKASLVITDSGGLQKEAYFNKKFCITTRDETEWKELVTIGVNYVTSANKTKILDAFSELKNKKFEVPIDIYGKGNAAKVILENLLINTL